jgi:hypothetical protein
MTIDEYLEQSNRDENFEDRDFGWDKYLIQVWRSVCWNREKYGDQIDRLENEIAMAVADRYGDQTKVAFNVETKEVLVYDTEGFNKEFK